MRTLQLRKPWRLALTWKPLSKARLSKIKMSSSREKGPLASGVYNGFTSRGVDLGKALVCFPLILRQGISRQNVAELFMTQLLGVEREEA
jgi:hypothetical protein